ncbi:MAG: tetratricopeptide repeat protein [Burkholderiales bacterium]
MSREEALSHLRAGRPQAGAALLESLLHNQPADAFGWFVLGACRHALNELPAAACALSRSLSLDPTNSDAHLAYVSVLRAAGDASGALAASQQALSQSPRDARLLYAIALCFDDLGQSSDATAHYEKALNIDPIFEDALHNRGLLLARLGRLEDAEANQRRYVQAFPNSPRAHSALIDILIAQRRFTTALGALDELNALAPRDVSVPIRRGVALSGLRRFDEARAIFAKAQARDPQAVAQFLQHIAPNADADYLVSPENLFLWQSWLAMGQCDWSSWDDLVAEMRRLPSVPGALIEPAAAFMALHLPLSGPERHAIARQIAERVEASSPMLPTPMPTLRSLIRIGVLSPNLREHVMAYLLLPLFELLDRTKFELYAYSLTVIDPDSQIQARLCAAADRIRDVHAMTDEDAAACIREDDIDILIDAAGHTTGTRFGIAAARPARVQTLYEGFAGSLGSSRVDYVFIDPVVASSPAEWSETPIYLPHTYYLYDFRLPLPATHVSRRDYGLPEDAFVYCAFHKPEKISPDSFMLWTRVLREVANSVLWLQALPATAQRNLQREAAAQGVEPARLIFAPFEPRHDPRYLARHRLGDLMLDALHHNAVATASDALASALPVLTLQGSAMASRSGASLLHAAGLPELVTQDQDAYVALAVQLASDRERLRRYRRTLEARTGPLFDTESRVREIEAALMQMWQQYQQHH